jgi:hypothetical protein
VKDWDVSFPVMSVKADTPSQAAERAYLELRLRLASPTPPPSLVAVVEENPSPRMKLTGQAEREHFNEYFNPDGSRRVPLISAILAFNAVNGGWQ